jgi:hypothetical protein
MKKYEIYKNIRKRAVIMGLPISLFALMMTSIIGTLLLIIFSFRFTVIIGLFLWNGMPVYRFDTLNQESCIDAVPKGISTNYQ